jgi:acyl carrier protein
MSVQNQEDEVLQFLSLHLKLPKEKLSHDVRFVEDLGVDSLSSIELLVSFEEKFGVVISQEDATEKIKVVADLLSFVRKEA